MAIVPRTAIVAGRLCNLSDVAPLNDSLSAWICDCSVCGFELDLAQVDEICKPDVCTGPKWMALAPKTAASLVPLTQIPIRDKKGSQLRGGASALHNCAKCSLVDVSVTSHPTCRGSALAFRCIQERKAGGCCCAMRTAAWHRPLASNKAFCSRKAMRRGCTLGPRRCRAVKSCGWRPSEKLRM